MEDDLVRSARRWLAADRVGRDEEADSALRVAFEAMPRAEVPERFATRVMDAVGEAAARDRVRTRWSRAAVVAGVLASAAATAYVGAGLIGSLAGRAFVAFVSFSVNAIVWLIGMVQRGADVWTILGGIARVTGSVVIEPRVSFVLIAIQVIGVLALVALQRLLGPEEESSR
jgi:hypothetical protein